MSDKPIDIATARARSLGITPIQLRNRNNPYELHCPECGDHLVRAWPSRKSSWDICEKCQLRTPGDSMGEPDSDTWEYIGGDAAALDTREQIAPYREIGDGDLYGDPLWRWGDTRSDMDDLPF